MVEQGKIVAGARPAEPGDGPPPSTLRRFAPWSVSLLGNAAFFLLFALLARSAVKMGVPDPGPSIEIELVSADALPPDPRERDRAADAPPQVTVPEEEAPAETPPEPVSTETVPAEEAPSEPRLEETPEPTPPEPSPPQPSPQPQPQPARSGAAAQSPADIALPEAEGGGPEGIVAIRCYELFSDPDKAAECAGRNEILSGWTGEGEDWSAIADALARGGVDVEEERRTRYGPQAGTVPRGWENYEPFDASPFIGRQRAAEIKDWQRFRELKAASEGISEMQSPIDNLYDNTGGLGIPFYGDRWEPSWTLREDIYVDRALLDEMIADSERRAREE